MRRTLQFALALAVASVALAFGTAAGAGGAGPDNPDYTAPPPTSVVRNSVPTTVAQPATTPPARNRLAITGSDMSQLVLVGGVLVAGGAGTMVLRRRSAA